MFWLIFTDSHKAFPDRNLTLFRASFMMIDARILNEKKMKIEWAHEFWFDERNSNLLTKLACSGYPNVLKFRNSKNPHGMEENKQSTT